MSLQSARNLHRVGGYQRDRKISRAKGRIGDGWFALDRYWDLLCWAKRLLLSGVLALAEPKRLRQRLFHVAGRIVRSGRRTILRLPRRWPWADALRTAFERLRELPAGATP